MRCLLLLLINEFDRQSYVKNPKCTVIFDRLIEAKDMKKYVFWLYINVSLNFQKTNRILYILMGYVRYFLNNLKSIKNYFLAH